MLFKTIKVDGLSVFYREAGQETAPKLVLLHGFPASSHQYRNLIPALADRFHVIAPDYPGFGNSDMPDPSKFGYTFDKTSEIIEALLQKTGCTRFGLYLQDYGGPVGFRIIPRRPQWLQWLIIQNTNAYEVGFTPVWDGLRGAYWKNRTPETEKPLEAFLEANTKGSASRSVRCHPDLGGMGPRRYKIRHDLLAVESSLTESAASGKISPGCA
jgi:pimeloyl-ACP methyl ester carboxylesterase